MKSTRAARWEYVQNRFHELAVKSALQTATPEEEKKLEKLQVLRRMMLGTDRFSSHFTKQDWQDRQLLKRLRGLAWENSRKYN